MLYNQDDVVTFTVPADDGGVYWGYLEAFTGKYSLWIVREKPLETKLQFGAEQMKQELDKAGRVAVYGINFDVNKAFLKAGSEKVIAEMVKLMLQNPELRVEIQGHTDSTGTAGETSNCRRARQHGEKSFMLLYGIAPERLETSGHGDTAPLESERHRGRTGKEPAGGTREAGLIRLSCELRPVLRPGSPGSHRVDYGRG